MMPTERPVPPEARKRRSSTTTFRTPRSARWKAMEQPVTPPPMMTTSALRGTLMLEAPRSARGRWRGRDRRPAARGRRPRGRSPRTCDALGPDRGRARDGAGHQEEDVPAVEGESLAGQEAHGLPGVLPEGLLDRGDD